MKTKRKAWRKRRTRRGRFASTMIGTAFGLCVGIVLGTGISFLQDRRPAGGRMVEQGRGERGVGRLRRVVGLPQARFHNGSASRRRRIRDRVMG